MEITVKTERKCVLRDVLHVPDLSYNLFSVPKAMEGGATVMFDDLKSCIFNKKQKLITEGTKKGRLYHLECENSAGSERIHATLWHRRYGHLSSKYLQLLAKKKLVTSFNYNCLKSIDFCESCVEGK